MQHSESSSALQYSDGSSALDIEELLAELEERADEIGLRADVSVTDKTELCTAFPLCKKE